MTCFHPLTAGRYLKDGKPISKPVFGKAIEAGMVRLHVPCGQCIGCRLERSRMWALRICHESRLHDSNSFLTLTYDDSNLPPDMSISLEHMQKFWKRLRKRTKQTFKIFYCGEYGEKKYRPVGPFNPRQYHAEGQRPHYHACVLGLDFPDKEVFTVRDGITLYHSPFLTDVWGKGHCTVGAVTFESAAYVARYCLKKVNGKLAEKPDDRTGLLPYERCCPYTGNITSVTPEFAYMSRGGRSGRGIGFDHYSLYSGDIYPHDYVVWKGRELKTPRYYDNLYDLDDPETMDEIRARRAAAAEDAAWNATPARLKVRETVQKAKLQKLSRGLNNDL